MKHGVVRGIDAVPPAYGYAMKCVIVGAQRRCGKRAHCVLHPCGCPVNPVLSLLSFSLPSKPDTPSSGTCIRRP